MDREEMAFYRAQRSWVYRAAEGTSNSAAFGSTRNLDPVGTLTLVNCPWPVLEIEAAKPSSMVIG